MNLRSLAALFMVCQLTGCGSSESEVSSAQVADRLDIADAVSRYSYAIDFGDADGFESLFTEDAIWVAYEMNSEESIFRFETREEIRALADNDGPWVGGRKCAHHQSGLTFVELTSSTAKTQNMVLISCQASDETTPTIRTSGTYYDSWQRTSDGWKIALREFRVDGPRD